MLSICCNICVKLWKNKKRSAKNNKIKSFINQYNCEGINFSSEKDERKKFEKNNVTITLNVLYVKKENIYPAYISKYKSGIILQ